MTRRIKYEFHALRTKDPNEYMRKLSKANFEYRLRRKKHREEHKEYFTVYLKEYYKSHKWKYKTWILNNCIICGRFCPKTHTKYCSIKCYRKGNYYQKIRRIEDHSGI